MKHVLPVAIVAVLIVVAAVLSLTMGTDRGGEAQGNKAVLYPAVWQALETAPSVEVYVALRRPDVPLGEITRKERQQHARATQERVLSALGPEDFEPTYAFEYYGLSGRVTQSGLLILAEHPDVRGVEIPVGGTYNIGPAAQDTASASLTGAAYRLVDQTIVDGVVVHETEVPVTDGRIVIPELGVNLPLSVDGTFRFSDLPVSADTDNLTLITVIFTAPGLGSFTFLNLSLYPGNGGPNLTPQLIDTPRVNDLSRHRR